MIGAFGGGGVENVVHSLSVESDDGDLAALPLLQQDRLLDGVFVEFVDDGSQPGGVQGRAARVDGQLLDQVRNQLDGHDDVHAISPLRGQRLGDQLGDVPNDQLSSAGDDLHGVFEAQRLIGAGDCQDVG